MNHSRGVHAVDVMFNATCIEVLKLWTEKIVKSLYE